MSLRRPLLAALLAVPCALLPAQDHLKEMPGYARYTEMAPKIAGSFVSGAITPAWAEDGKSFQYTRSGTRMRYDIAARRAEPSTDSAQTTTRRPGFSGVARGRQATEAMSPDSSKR